MSGITAPCMSICSCCASKSCRCLGGVAATGSRSSKSRRISGVPRRVSASWSVRIFRSCCTASKSLGCTVDLDDVTYYVGHETVIRPRGRQGPARLAGSVLRGDGAQRDPCQRLLQPSHRPGGRDRAAGRFAILSETATSDGFRAMFGGVAERLKYTPFPYGSDSYGPRRD